MACGSCRLQSLPGRSTMIPLPRLSASTLHLPASAARSLSPFSPSVHLAFSLSVCLSHHVQRGNLMALEMKNNSHKLARFTLSALLAGADSLRLGLVSRANRLEAAEHELLGVHTVQPATFASQLALNPANAFGVLRWVVESVRKHAENLREEEDDPDTYIAKCVHETVSVWRPAGTCTSGCGARGTVLHSCGASKAPPSPCRLNRQHPGPVVVCAICFLLRSATLLRPRGAAMPLLPSSSASPSARVRLAAHVPLGVVLCSGSLWRPHAPPVSSSAPLLSALPFSLSPSTPRCSLAALPPSSLPLRSLSLPLTLQVRAAA